MSNRQNCASLSERGSQLQAALRSRHFLARKALPCISRAAVWSRIQSAETSRGCRAEAGVQAASEAEEAANKKRWEESGGGQGSIDEWRWTLNWDKIEPHQIIVGSCPRSPGDIDRIVEEAGATAILSLQSDLCLEAMGIDYPVLRRQAVRQGVLVARVAVRDFDHNDQAFALPEAVRMLHALLSMGRTVYVHCTAGINRATLTVVGYLTFIQGLSLQEAVAVVKTARPQAHPYIDCWKTVRSRLVASRAEEVMLIAESLFNERKATGAEEDGFADWVAAENMLIRETFNRQLESTLSLVRSIQESQEASLESLYCYSEGEVEGLAAEISALQQASEAHRAAMERAVEELAVAREELSLLRDAGADEEQGVDPAVRAEVLQRGQREVAAMRTAVKDMARKTSVLLQQRPLSSVDSSVDES